jgi:hypothetical protein
MDGQNYPPIRVGERRTLSADFTRELGPGETIVGGSVVANNIAVTANDPTAGAMWLGSPTLVGNVVSQIIAPDASRRGIIYAPTWSVQTSIGQIITLPVFGEGYLSVA